MHREPKDNKKHMRIGTVMGGGDWPFCIASIEPVEVASGAWEFRFPVPIPEKTWEVRTRWPIGDRYHKDLVKQGALIDVHVKNGYVESVVLKGSLPYKGTLELQVHKPGPPLDSRKWDRGSERVAVILTGIQHEDVDHIEEGFCQNCEEELEEGFTKCSECGHDNGTVSPTLGELVAKYGPEARPEVSYDRQGASFSIRYTLDDEGLTKEKAEKQAKYDAEMAEYEQLQAEWDELEEKVNAYDGARTEEKERAKLAELQAKYKEGS